MRILIVEDEIELRQAIARHLRGLGHGVDECSDGRSAREMAAVYEHDAMILDRMLPDGDSVRLLASWRTSGKHVPVLFLTARDRVCDRVEGLQSGADDYLIKPFAMEELVARLNALGRRGSTPRPAVMRIGTLEIDSARREVRRGGVLVPLRPKEFVLLDLLVARHGRVVSRQKIIDTCWDESREPMSNVEESLVASLRRKLGKPNLIRTVRGGGYMFEGSAEDDD